MNTTKPAQPSKTKSLGQLLTEARAALRDPKCTAERFAQALSTIGRCEIEYDADRFGSASGPHFATPEGDFVWLVNLWRRACGVEPVFWRRKRAIFFTSDDTGDPQHPIARIIAELKAMGVEVKADEI